MYRILGIDPGLRRAGYAILIIKNGKTFIADVGYLKMSSKQSIPERVFHFHQFFKEKIEQFTINHVALETPFLGKNAQTFLKLGYLRGAIYLLAQAYVCTIHEFSPREIKTAVTGYGGAGKEQVASMLFRLCSGLASIQKSAVNDVTDALAVGLCCMRRVKSLLRR